MKGGGGLDGLSRVAQETTAITQELGAGLAACGETGYLAAGDL